MTQTNSPFPRSSSVAAYLRDSGGDEQDQSVPQQERAVQEWCNENGLELTRIFRDEARPGSSVIGRKSFQDMIHYFHGKKVPEAGLVIWSLARFSRDIMDSQYYLADLRRRGFIIHSLIDAIPEGLNGKLVEFVKLWQNDAFLENLSKEVKRGVNDLMKEHGALGGTPPRGFMREKIELGKHRNGERHIVHKWVPDPAMIDRVRLAWDMRAHGASYKQIMAATHIYSAESSFRTFFENRIYLGEMEFAGVIYPDYVEPIIDQATWDAVQKLMVTGRGHIKPGMQPLDNPRRASSRYLLSGLAYCEACGSLLNGQYIPYNDSRHSYYTCSGRWSRHDCDARVIPQEPLESAVIDELRDYILRPEILDALRAEANRMGDERTQESADQIAQLNQQLGSVRMRMANIVNAIEVTPESTALAERLSKLEQEERDLLRRVKAFENEKRATRKSTDAEMLENVRKIFLNFNDIPLEDRRMILAGFISRVSVVKKEKTIQGKVLFFAAPKLVLSQNEFL